MSRHWRRGAAVFKTLNQVGFEVMDNADGYAAPPVMFVAGDASAHKPLVMDLVSELGFLPVDVGGLRAARLLDGSRGARRPWRKLRRRDESSRRAPASAAGWRSSVAGVQEWPRSDKNAGAEQRDREVCRLAGGASRIRTLGPTCDGIAVKRRNRAGGP